MKEKSAEQDRKADRIEEDTVFLNGAGRFPKRLVIFECGKALEYRIIRTQNGKYQLNK